MPSSTIAAPVTGRIGEIKVTEGQGVNAGDVVIVLSTAKTENNVTAPSAGMISLLVQQGTQVNQGDRLAVING